MFKWCVLAALLPLPVWADDIDATALIGAMSNTDVPVMQLADNIPAILGATILPEVGVEVAQSQYFTEDDAQGFLAPLDKTGAFNVLSCRRYSRSGLEIVRKTEPVGFVMYDLLLPLPLDILAIAEPTDAGLQVCKLTRVTDQLPVTIEVVEEALRPLIGAVIVENLAEGLEGLPVVMVLDGRADQAGSGLPAYVHMSMGPPEASTDLTVVTRIPNSGK